MEGGLAKSVLNMGDEPKVPFGLSILSGDAEYFLRSLLPPPPTIPIKWMGGKLMVHCNKDRRLRM